MTKRHPFLKCFLPVLAILLSTGAVNGCAHHTHFGLAGDPGKTPPYRETDKDKAQITTLTVILHGPFAVVVHRNQGNRITAYVPVDENHEIRFPDPMTTEKRHKSYFVKMSSEGLETSPQPPYLDHGYDDFNVGLPVWPPPGQEHQKYFVQLELPAPDIITYQPPPAAVLFQSKDGSAGKAGQIPLNHILVYKVRDVRKIHMYSKELGEIKPELCSDVMRAVDAYRKRWPEPEKSPDDFPSGDWEQCKHTASVFFGIGLPPDLAIDRQKHALSFFNDTLLRSLYGNSIPKDKKLAAIGRGIPGSSSTPRLTYHLEQPRPSRSIELRPVVWDSRPRMIEVTAGDNCQSPGATAHTP